MTEQIQIKEAGVPDIKTIRELALLIWPPTYREILTPAQLDYMLNLIYSEAALAEQINKKQHQFLIIYDGDLPVGFASWSASTEKEICKLQKLYVRSDIQGKGLGKSLLQEVKVRAKTSGFSILHLNVNRYNKAIGFYEKQGFKIIKEEDVDIGNNYFMNDYVMEIPLT